MDDQARHPLLLVPRPVFWVPPIRSLAKAINLGIEFNRHGIVALGFGRIGKSTALALLSQDREWRQYSCYWHSVLPGKPVASSESYFFNTLRVSMNLKVREQTQSIFSIEHAVNYLCEQAASAGAQVIILSIDDANRLQGGDYDHLVTLDNHITARGFRLFVVLMVQSDADRSDVPSFDKDQYPSQITGRFTADEYTYLGLDGLSEIREALCAFGNQVHNGRTFLEEFAGNAVRNGWHIDQHAEGIVAEAAKLRAESGLDPDAPFPMQCFDTACYYLLVRVAAESPEFNGLGPESLRKAIEISGLIEIELSRQPKDVKK